MEDKIVDVSNLSVSYYKNNEFRVNDVNFYLGKGEVMGIIGRNGAGKTTLLKSIVGLKGIDSGEVFINGFKQGEDNKSIKKIIGYISSEWMYDLTVKLEVQAKNLGSYYDGFSYDRFGEICARLGIKKKSRPLFLSAGEKVKFTLAFALSHNPKLLVMDEPMSCLDPVSRDEIMDILREIIEDGQVSIIYSTHMIHELETIADRILFMDSGCQKMFLDVNQIQDKYFQGRKMDLEELFERL
ncbi:MAG: ABC transporter ATP-binding protein [Lachnospiraceae bacterium]|nr:ABC transporter ATP-binding protein [Lachnospiraceae bacterium]